MTIENGAAEAANDTTVAEQNTDQTNAENNTEVTGGEGAQNTEAPADDEEEIEYEGERFRIPRKLREAIAKPMLSDYTKKTTELSELRKSFDGEKEQWGKTTAAQRAHFEEAAKVIAYNNSIKEAEESLGKYANVDWLTLSQTNPDQYQQHRAYYDTLRDRKAALIEQRDSAARTWSQKEQEYASNANREHGERVAKAQADIAKHVEGWAPGNELDQKIAAFGNSVGLATNVMAELAIREPILVKLLNQLRISHEAAKKQETQQAFQQSQQAKPVTRVGGNGGSAVRKTTDSSGDALSDAEWVKRERERLQKRA